MAQLNYHRRYCEDGSCQVICTGCFATVGVAFNNIEARALEQQHTCAARTDADIQPHLCVCGAAACRKRTSTEELIQRFLDVSPRHRMYPPLAILSAVAFLYALPTAVELVASQFLNVWLSCIVPGNLAGCICIGAIFRMPRTAIVLYLTLAILEGYLLLSHLLSHAAVLWVVDLVPTLTVAALVIYTSRARVSGAITF